MQRYIKPISFLFLLFLFQNSSCQWINCIEVEETPVAVEGRETAADFQEIELSVPAVVHISQGMPQEIKIAAMESVLEQIITEVKDGELEIRYRECVRNPDSIRIYITTEKIRELEINGTGRFITEYPIRSEELNLVVNGSGTIELEALNAGSLQNTINGSGTIYIGSGKAGRMKIKINGSGEVDAMGLRTLETTIKINGSGECAVFAEELLKVTINGSGDISYHGDAKLEETVNGSGDIKKAE